MVSGMDRRVFLPGGLKAERVELVDDRALIHARPAGGAAACPRYGEISGHVHSHYERRLADLSAHWAGSQACSVRSALSVPVPSVPDTGLRGTLGPRIWRWL